MRFLLIASISTLSLSLAAQQKTPFSNLDVFELEWVTDPQISPDGMQVVYVRNGMDIMTDKRMSRLWMVNADGSEHVKLSEREMNESSPRWSPDGSRIAFTSSTEHGTEIYLYWIKSGKTSRLTHLLRSPSGLSWSPDGTHLAFSMLAPQKPLRLVKPPEKPQGATWADPPRMTARLKYEADGSGYLERGFNHLFILPADGGTPRQVTDGDFQHTGRPQWSADGLTLYFSSNRNPDWEYDYRNREIYSVSLTDGKISVLTKRNGPDTEPVISPDGSSIAYLSYEDKIQTYQIRELWIMNNDGSGKRQIKTGLDRNISRITWDAEGTGLYYQYDDSGDSKIGYTSIEGRTSLLATNLGGTAIGRPYGGGSFSVSRSGPMAFTHTDPYHPAELALLRRGEQMPSLITGLNQDLLPYRDLAKVEDIWYKSSVDGRAIQGWIAYPPGYDADQAYPLIVENHGGPISNYGARFSPEIQLYAAAGYVVFYPNPRGSTGYGEEFGNLLYHNYPGEDYQDVMDGVDELIRRGITAEDRLYVTGGSAGGIMTAWIIGKNNRFEAAAVVKPVMNWISKTLTADNYYGYAHYRYPGQPWENFDEYWKFSPISLVGNVETPTLVMVGTADMRTPLSESKQLYSALKLRQVETVLIELPGAWHNIAKRPSQLIAKVDHVVAWFDNHRD